VLVVASAGSTAAAFARVCSLASIPCLIVVPETALVQLRFTEPLGDSVRFVALAGGADYDDAMQLADRVSQMDGFTAEGGARNVGRRDALAVPFLAAVEAIGRMPDLYFQAVGSGAGAIATHEVVNRLVTDGRFGNRRPRLMLSQNAPFCPIYRSWSAGGRELWTADRNEAKRSTQELIAPVLSHPRPPYDVRGGVFDALVASHGDVLIADNDQVLHAQRLFQETEGIDVHPAAGVATSSLITAVRENRVDRDATIMLNVTGGGAGRLLATGELVPATPALELSAADLGDDDTLARIVAC
jgi:cysteate synthase